MLHKDMMEEKRVYHKGRNEEESIIKLGRRKRKCMIRKGWRKRERILKRGFSSVHIYSRLQTTEYRVIDDEQIISRFGTLREMCDCTTFSISFLSHYFWLFSSSSLSLLSLSQDNFLGSTKRLSCFFMRQGE